MGEELGLGFTAPLAPNWDFSVLQAAQSSFRSAHHLFHCISGPKITRSIHEMSLAAKRSTSDFRVLLSLLDGLAPPHRKRIRKGPLPTSLEIDPIELLDHRYSPENATSLMHASRFQLYQQAPAPTLTKNRFLQFDSCTDQFITAPSQPPFLSSISVDNGGINRQLINYFSSPSVQRSINEDSSIFDLDIKHVENGCRCLKKRKLRLKRTIRVPAVSSKLADIPSDDYSWRKYGQKPIKGSPHPRSYYMCSSMRGCTARKHVERCLDDGNMMSVTYEGEHNHPRITLTTPNIVFTQ